MGANCCDKTFDLGCIDCGTINLKTPVVAAMSGTFIAVYKYIGRDYRYAFEGVMGDFLYIPTQALNEEFTYRMYILDPNGDRVTYTTGGVEYDCFQVQTHACRTEEVENPDLTGLSCPMLNDPDSGLTKDQRLDCILPGYDFADDPTFDALTDQQEDDLTERLCGAPSGGDCYYLNIALGT